MLIFTTNRPLHRSKQTFLSTPRPLQGDAIACITQAPIVALLFCREHLTFDHRGLTNEEIAIVPRSARESGCG
jgi:hypothetical protein